MPATILVCLFSRKVALRAAVCLVAMGGAGVSDGARAAVPGGFHVVPQQIRMVRNFDQVQILATANSVPGVDPARAEDFTPRASFVVADPSIASVSQGGRVLGLANGRTTITVTITGDTWNIPVEVQGIVPEPKIDFITQVLPIMSKAGCNGGACHATQYGKGGFVLSVLGYDPAMDHGAILRDRMQRRINLMAPAESLFLKKPLMQVPHGGGRRIANHSVDEQLLTAWIAAGAPGPNSVVPRVTAVHISPVQRICRPGEQQQLRVTADYDTGETRDITASALYDSQDESVASILPSGRYTAKGRGQTAIMVRYEGFAEISVIAVPYAERVDLAGWQSRNRVDEIAAAKFRELGIAPSPLCDDATFLRRVFLDALGSLPTVAETREFLASSDSRKRERLIDQVLGFAESPRRDVYNERYASWWALKWADLLRNSSASAGDQGMYALHDWLRDAFRQNKKFDQFTRELLTARGSAFNYGPANYFRIAQEPAELAETTAQVFLGVRLQCAKCHHHPFEKYSQEDYYRFAAYFARVGTKLERDFGAQLSEPVVFIRSSGTVTHPRTGKAMSPAPLEGTAAPNPHDPRAALADWITGPHNDHFPRNIVNRYVSYLLGRGLVEPVDDLRATNSPTNIALMEELAREFRASGYDLRQLLRTVMNSRLYQLDSQPTPQNHTDTKFYSYFRVKRMSAEALLDAMDDVTGTRTKFAGIPAGTRAIELPDANYTDPFLVTFGKPKRASVCECERSADENLSQALHTLNGEILIGKINDPRGRLAALLAASRSHDQIVEEFYLAALSRFPSVAEVAASQRLLQASPNPREFYQDLLWALLNSKQFLFVR